MAKINLVVMEQIYKEICENWEMIESKAKEYPI